MQYTHYRQRHLIVFDVNGYMFRHQLCAITKPLHILKKEEKCYFSCNLLREINSR